MSTECHPGMLRSIAAACTCDVAAQNVITVNQGAAPAIHRQDFAQRVAAVLLLRRRCTKRWPMPAHANAVMHPRCCHRNSSRQSVMAVKADHLSPKAKALQSL